MEDKAFLSKMGLAIARQRKAAGLTQKQLAKSLGMTNDALSRIENGYLSVGLENVFKMRDIFGCSLPDLLWVEEDDLGHQIVELQRLINSVPEKKRYVMWNMLEGVARES